MEKSKICMCNFSNMGYIYDTSGLSLLSPFSKTPGGTYSCRALGSHKPHHGRYHLLEKETVAVAVFESVCLSDLVVFYPYPQILPPLMSFFLFRPSPQVMLAVKNLPANAIDVRNTGSIPAPSRSPGGGFGNPLQYSLLENHMERGAWQATVHRVTESDSTEMT